MVYVYIIESEANGRLYIGQTHQPDKRLDDHNRGASSFTKNRGPWNRIFLKEFSTREEAMLFEKKMKAWKNPKRIKDMIAKNAGG